MRGRKMENFAMTPRSLESLPEKPGQLPRFHSVEFSIDGLEFAYQFKLWNMDSDSMHIIIKEGSDILNRLKTGNKLNIKYYSDNVSYPVTQLSTEISYVTKAGDGRFRGHYIVGLSVAEHPQESIAH
jgi:hypothetical protein